MNPIILFFGIASHQLYAPNFLADGDPLCKALQVSLTITFPKTDIKYNFKNNDPIYVSSTANPDLAVEIRNIGGKTLTYSYGNIWDQCKMLVTDSRHRPVALTKYGQRYFAAVKQFAGQGQTSSLEPGKEVTFHIQAPLSSLYKFPKEPCAIRLQYFPPSIGRHANEGPCIFTNPVNFKK